MSIKEATDRYQQPRALRYVWYGAVLWAGLMFFVVQPAFAGGSQNGLRTYLDVSIQMDKKIYKLGERLEGKVVIYNRAPATLFGGFDVKLYKDAELRYATTVYVKTLFPGKTKFRFKNFGVPKLKEDDSSLGSWRLVVHQSNRPEDKVEAEFVIGPAGLN